MQNAKNISASTKGKKKYGSGRSVSYDNTFGMVDLKVYVDLMADDNSDQMNRLKRNLAHALRNDITERQREYMLMYYGQNMTMEEIAQHCHVNKSTVSRTLKRGRARLHRCLRYGASNLLEQANS